MKAAELTSVLRRMMPIGFVEVSGCVLWPEDAPPSPELVEAALQGERRVRALVPALTPSDERMRFEGEFNRRFIVSALEHVGAGQWAPADILICAEAWAALLRDALRRRFGERPFKGSVIGAEGGEDEPLEVCVTFCQA